jgi:type II restriction enzyme
LSIDLANYENVAAEATKTFWRTRLSAKENQQATGKADQGERSSVTAGKNMDGFLNLMIDVVKANGLPSFQIHYEEEGTNVTGLFQANQTMGFTDHPQ